MDDRCIPEVCKSNLPRLKRNAQVRFVSLQVLCSPSPVCTKCLWIPQHRGFLHIAILWCRRKGGSAQRSSSSMEEAAAPRLPEQPAQHWMAWNEHGTGLRGQKLSKLNFHQRTSMVKVLRWLWIFRVAPKRNGNILWEYPCLSSPKAGFHISSHPRAAARSHFLLFGKHSDHTWRCCTCTQPHSEGKAAPDSCSLCDMAFVFHLQFMPFLKTSVIFTVR